jgi:hypothetical protein
MGHEVLGYHPKDLYSLTYRQLIFLYWNKQIDVRQADYNTYLIMWPHLAHEKGEQPLSIEKFKPLRCDPGYVAPKKKTIDPKTVAKIEVDAQKIGLKVLN